MPGRSSLRIRRREHLKTEPAMAADREREIERLHAKIGQLIVERDL
jgi:hypothetical protein